MCGSVSVAISLLGTLSSLPPLTPTEESGIQNEHWDTNHLAYDAPSSAARLDLNPDLRDSNSEDPVSAVENYCSTDDWVDMHQRYKAAHGAMSLIVCIIGSLANIINIVVLTRRSMVSPTNGILTALALTDLLVMTEYIPYTMHSYIWKDRPLEDMFSWGWAIFIIFHAHFSNVFHTISIWLTVMLAVWRYIAIAHPANNMSWCSMEKTRNGIVAAFACSIILNIPNYLNLSIMVYPQENNTTLYIVNFSDLALANDEFLKILNLWVYAVLLKLVPCVALTALSLALIQELLRAARRRAALMTVKGRGAEAERQADRVTKMLLAILVLFLASEFCIFLIGKQTVLPVWYFPYFHKVGNMMKIIFKTGQHRISTNGIFLFSYPCIGEFISKNLQKSSKNC
ncbi:unnamed protein product, partial [Meganyctiphanes norvegica]